MIIGLSIKQIFGYAGTPQIKQRLESLISSGFKFIAYFMALVYSAVNLLPQNHPYTQVQNMGQFGIRHVIAEAANNLEFKKENIDQILLFGALLIGIILVFMQIMLLGTSMFIQPVFAGTPPASFTELFITPTATETTDIAHIMMDLVFGVGDGTNNLFNSCVSQGITCTESLPAPGVGTRDVMTDAAGDSIYDPYGFPFPIHEAMHQMFQLYNTGLLVVAAFITSYFIVTIIAETAQTGTPFGRRFNKVWAPIRLVFAIGLLIPVGFGFNGSQWAVLYAAKFGSGFATNGWNIFNASITGGYFGDLKKLVSAPNIPQLSGLYQFFYTAKTCQTVEEYSNETGVDPIGMFLVKGAPDGPIGTPYLELTHATDYQQLVNFAFGSNNVRIRFGRQDADIYSQYLAGVKPYCGELVFRLTDPRRNLGAIDLDSPEPGLRIMQQAYWEFLLDLWFGVFDNGATYLLPADNYPENTVRVHTNWNRNDTLPLPGNDYKALLGDIGRDGLENVLLGPGGAIPAMEASSRYNVETVVTEKGWAGAAIWYNRIAEMNGAVTSAALNIPYPSRFPEVMEHIHEKKKLLDNDVAFNTRFLPILSNGDPVQFESPEDAQIANALWVAFSYWQTDSGGATSHTAPTGNAMIDSINALFGTEGLYNIRRNPNVHPLAQIVGVGRSLVESSIRNLTIAVIGGAGGNLLGFLDESLSQVAGVMGSFLVTVTMVGLTAGFILFYIVPFLPFIYFFFAVGGWIKGIFEAMVGAPLWALAHIRIDQNGLPGQAAVAGYFLIFEIFLRPILIIFGMLASISIFSALVSVLHQIFDLVTTNVGGFDYRAESQTGTGTLDGETLLSTVAFARSAIDEFFFTVVYTIIIYLMAMSSFKLIDLIPNNILRWMGQSIATFNDQREDAAQGLVGKATVGAQQTSSALGGGLKSIAS